MARTEARRMNDKKKAETKLFRGELLPPNKCTPKKIERENKGHSKHKNKQFDNFDYEDYEEWID